MITDKQKLESAREIVRQGGDVKKLYYVFELIDDGTYSQYSHGLSLKNARKFLKSSENTFKNRLFEIWGRTK